MGLRKKQETDGREGEKFDMRRTVEDYKRAVWAYSFWKPTMLIHVRHIRRKDLPHFVFPGGVRPCQPVKVASERRLLPKQQRLNSSQVNVAVSEKKRKRDEVTGGVGLKEPMCMAVGNNYADFEGDSRAKRQVEADVEDALTSASCPQKISYDHQEVEGSVRYCQPSVPLCSGSSSSCAALGEDLAIEQSSELSISHQGASKVLDELEDDLGLMDQVQHVGSATKGIPVQCSAKHEIASATEASPTATATATVTEIGSTSYKLYQSGVLEELEVLTTIFVLVCAH